MPLENRLAELLEEKGLSMYALAKRADLTYQTIFNLVHKKSTRIDLDTLEKICDVLDAEPGRIFAWTPKAGASRGG
jgi:DNA-binding Xre family transcriptional regulator